MLRRRGTAVVVLSVGLAALAVAGCGRDDFANDPRPPIPAEVSVKMAPDGVAVSPREFGAGIVNFTIANLTNTSGALVIDGPVDSHSEQIVPAATGTLKVQMKTGTYEASVDGFNVRPFSFTVGSERASGQNDLLLP